MKFFKVGGCVRDALMGVDSKDVDFAVEAASFTAMRDHLLADGFEIFVETPEFLTIRARSPRSRQTFDFVLARKDGAYSDGRRPDEVTPGTILDDLARRDFTMNAIAEAEDGTLIDPFDGQADIAAGVIRAVGDPRVRIQEDALRALRALRFAITKGMRLDVALVAVLDSPETAALLSTVSVERIREEMERAFLHDTLGTLRLLASFPHLERAVFDTGIRLLPTLRAR